MGRERGGFFFPIPYRIYTRIFDHGAARFSLSSVSLSPNISTFFFFFLFFFSTYMVCIAPGRGKLVREMGGDGTRRAKRRLGV